MKLVCQKNIKELISIFDFISKFFQNIQDFFININIIILILYFFYIFTRLQEKSNHLMTVFEKFYKKKLCLFLF